MRAGLALTWARGARDRGGGGGRGGGRGGGGTPSGMSPCRSRTGVGGLGAGGVTGLSLTASAPAPSRASCPPPAPPESSKASKSPWDLQGTRRCYPWAGAHIVSVGLSRGRGDRQRRVTTATTWARWPASPSGAPFWLWPLHCCVPLGQPLSLSEPDPRENYS